MEGWERGKDCKPKWAYLSIFPLEFETKLQDTVLFRKVLPREKLFNHPFGDE